MIEKFHGLTEPVLAEDRRREIERAVFGLRDPGTKLSDLTALLYAPIA